MPHLRRAHVARLLAVTVATATIGSAALGGVLSAPAAAAPATPGQAGPVAPGEHTGLGGPRDAPVAVQRVADEDVLRTLDDLDRDVRRELAALEEARAALAEARAEVGEAERRVAETEEQLAYLEALSDEVVAEAFVSPPAMDGLAAFAADSVTDAAIKQSILDRQATRDAEVLDELAAVEAEVGERRAELAEAASRAADRKAEAEAHLAELEAAQSRQTAFVAEVEARLDRGLSEAEALARIDPEAARHLAERENEIAGKLVEIRTAEEQRRALEALAAAQAEAEREAAERARQEAEARAALRDLGPATGSLSTVPCPGGGSITVDSSLADNLRALLQDAAADGLQLCGGGYRDPERQIELRKKHCGTSTYAIYEAPSSSCSPPTARPGTSMHERGLAIDFTCNGGSMGGSACFRWMAANASRYGLHNLPSEPWHWSTNGR